MQTLQAYKGKVRALSFSADGVYLASAGASATTISLWHLATGRRSKLSSGCYRVPALMTFAPRGTTLALADYGLRLWPDPIRVAEQKVVPGVLSFTFGPDGSELALMHYDGRNRKSELR